MGYRNYMKNVVKVIDKTGYDTIMLFLPESKDEHKQCELTIKQQKFLIDRVVETYPGCKVITIPPKTKIKFVK